jgi:hypothetical protein
MSERKIRLTLSSTLLDDTGALIDVDFDSENLDVDLEVAAENGVSTLIKEYTVDAATGTYNLDISFKNDNADNSSETIVNDRNLIIEKIEFANNGVDYEPLIVNSSNTNLEMNRNFNHMGWAELPNPDYNPAIPKTQENHNNLKNPSFNESLPATDDNYNGPADNPGTNPLFSYQLIINPVTMYQNGTATFQINFV